MDSHCEILWADHSGAGLGIHPTAIYEAGLDDPQNQAIISQQRLRSKMLGLWIKNYLAAYSKHNIRTFRYTYTFNNQDDGSAMFLSFVKWCDLTHAQDSQKSSLICRTLRCLISNVINPNPTYIFQNVRKRSPLLCKNIRKL